jgi:hypothetical protein
MLVFQSLIRESSEMDTIFLRLDFSFDHSKSVEELRLKLAGQNCSISEKKKDPSITAFSSLSEP